MRSPFSLRAVNGGSAKYNALLLWMQLESLPLDIPADTCDGFWWVAYSGTQPAGFAGMYPSSQDPQGGYLCRAGVLPPFRGAGLQRKLIAARERKARSLGMRALYTDTYRNPHSSNNLIERGFRMFDPELQWAGPDACYWRKSIS